MKRSPVTPKMRRDVLERDGQCLVVRYDLEDNHVCRDAWGNEHWPDDIERLSIEHVHDGYGQMGKRAPSDLAHLVAICYAANLSVPSKAMRAVFRWHLARLYPDAA